MNFFKKILVLSLGSAFTIGALGASTVNPDIAYNKNYQTSFAANSKLTADDYLNTIDLQLQAKDRYDEDLTKKKAAIEAQKAAEKIAHEKAAILESMRVAKEREAEEAAIAAEQALAEQLAAQTPVEAVVEVHDVPIVQPLQSQEESIKNAPSVDYVLQTAGAGSQGEVNACIGAIDLTHTMYDGIPVLAQHWHCGGYAFPTWAGAVVQINGYGTYKVNGIVKILGSESHTTLDLPQGYELLYQTCLNNNKETMAFVSLTKI